MLELIKEEQKLFILNLVTIFSFCLYAYGIYLHVAIRGLVWGNMAIDLSIQILGPVFGVVMVVVLGCIILFISFYIDQFRATNVFLCWFWIFSLYQCAINSFLAFNGLPNEPINQFFKWLFPTLWYPIKEICFVLIALLLTYVFQKKIVKKEFDKLDIFLITILSVGLILATLMSQLFLINANILTYS